MSNQFLLKLSQNYIELLEDDNYYDVTIEVGKDPNVKIFRAHTNILYCRSPYLRRDLSSNKRYIYGGILSLNEQNASEIFKVLAAADMLLLQEIVDHLQKYFIENNSEWLEQHFEFTYQTCFQSKNLLELQKFCTDLMAKSPEKIFKSLDFTSLSEKSLIL